MEEELDSEFGDQTAQAEEELECKYGMRLRSSRQAGLWRRVKEYTVPAKFRDYANITFTDKLHLAEDTIQQYNTPGLSLQQYAKLYATVHCQLGVPNQYNFLTNNDVVGIILTQQHVSRGLKILVMMVPKRY